MNQQLYINGILMDVEEDLQVTLVYKSNLFNDVDKISTNTSKTISLPITNNNLAAIGYAGYSGVDSTYPYTTHDAEYYRNGMKILQGKAILLSLGEKIEISLMWGDLARLESFLKNKTKLNELESSAALPYENKVSIENYDVAKQRGYFWALYDPNIYKEDINVWESINTYQVVDADGNVQSEVTKEWQNKNYIQPNQDWFYGSPSASAGWVKALIEEQLGVSLNFPEDAVQYINDLAIPCVSKKTNEYSLNEYLECTINGAEIKNGQYASINIVKQNDSFEEFYFGSFLHKGVRVFEDGEFDIEITINVRDRLGEGMRGNEPKQIVLHTATLFINEDRYNIGCNRQHGYDLGNEVVYWVQPFSADENGDLHFVLKGKGRISLKQEDTLKVGFAFAGESDSYLVNGVLKVIPALGEEVATGMNYPISNNLPDVGVIDFVKFLCFITGTFARQTSNDGLTFAKNTILTDSIANGFAVDWTRRLVTIDGTTFTDDDMAQVNHYKWQEDEYVKSNYNGRITIDNKTLEEERDAYKMPFAATDGDNIPIIEVGENYGERTFNECEPRILNTYRLENGNIGLRFDIDVQKILDEKHPLLSSQNRFQQLEVTVRMNDLDLLEYDETRAVYLAQKGAYYAVKELTADSNGMAKAKLIKL